MDTTQREIEISFEATRAGDNGKRALIQSA